MRPRLSVACVLGLLATGGCRSDDDAVALCPPTELGRFGGCPADAVDLSGDPAEDSAGAEEPASDSGSDPEPTDALAGDPHLDLPADDGALEVLPEDVADLQSNDGEPTPDAEDASIEVVDAPDAPPEPCPPEMALVGTTCMDRYEAPNVAGGLPLVMYTYYDAQRWCEARGKRLCLDTEWTAACEGAAGTAYPYGSTRVPGRCNDEEVWRLYDQSLLNQWPSSASHAEIASLAELLAAARAAGSGGTAAANHVEWLYQGEGAGTNDGCVNEYGVYDLTGNVEEWTRRADGGAGPDFSGNLKGRYWAESRTCQGNVRTHGNAFRFYEIGFRCCRDSELAR
jgi:hypothetical protein